MFKGNSRNHFAPTPMDYMKSKIEQARRSLAPVDEAKSQSLVRPSSSGFSIIETENEDDADDEMSSGGTEQGDNLSIPNSPLLPLHRGSMLRDHSPLGRTLRIISQPITILLVTAIVFCGSSAAQQILGRFNLYQATYKFPFPLTISLIQFLFCEAVLLAWATLSHYLVRFRPQLRGSSMTMEPLTWDFATQKSTLPAAISYVASTAAMFSCLEYVPVNNAVFIMSPMIVFQLGLTKYLNPEGTQSISTALSCATLMLGAALTAISEPLPGHPGFNTPGAIAGLLACIAQPLHNSLVKKTLPLMEHHSMQLLHYILIASIAIILPMLVISGEVFDVASNCFFLDEPGFWLMILVLSLLSLLVCFTQFMLLAFTTPLTVMVLYFAKSALLVVPLSDSLNRSGLSWINVVGLCCSVLGLLSYLYAANYHRPKFGLKWNL